MHSPEALLTAPTLNDSCFFQSLLVLEEEKAFFFKGAFLQRKYRTDMGRGKPPAKRPTSGLLAF
jgi:hypothetical protein